MRMINRTKSSGLLGASAFAALMLTNPASAAQQSPVDLNAPAKPAPPPLKAAPTSQATGASTAPAVPGPNLPAAAIPAPPAPPPPAPPPLAHWTVPDAQALLAAIKAIGKEGLAPADYEPAKLAAMLAKGESADLDTLASRLFVWLAEDLRDGRTPMPARPPARPGRRPRGAPAGPPAARASLAAGRWRPPAPGGRR